MVLELVMVLIAVVVRVEWNGSVQDSSGDAILTTKTVAVVAQRLPIPQRSFRCETCQATELNI